MIPSRCRTLLNLSLLISAIWIQPVGAQPALVKDINIWGSSSPRELVAIGNVVYFVADNGINSIELWRSTGTAAGTVLVKDIRPSSAGSFPSALTNVNGMLYFAVDNGVHGRELWRSTGTAAGTVLVKDIRPSSAGSFPNALTNVNGVLYFVADNGVYGYELWRLAP